MCAQTRSGIAAAAFCSGLDLGVRLSCWCKQPPSLDETWPYQLHRTAWGCYSTPISSTSALGRRKAKQQSEILKWRQKEAIIQKLRVAWLHAQSAWLKVMCCA